MKLDIDTLMQASFVIVRDSEHYKRVCDRFRRQGFPVVPKMFTAVNTEHTKYLPKAKRAEMSALGIIQAASALDLDFVLVFEDDAYPAYDCYKRLHDELSAVEFPDDTDVLMLGNMHWIDHARCTDPATSLRDIDPTGTYGTVGHHLWGAHAVVYTRSGITHHIAAAENGSFNSDWWNYFSSKTLATTFCYFTQVHDKLDWYYCDCDNFSKYFPPVSDSATDVAPDTAKDTAPDTAPDPAGYQHTQVSPVDGLSERAEEGAKEGAEEDTGPGSTIVDMRASVEIVQPSDKTVSAGNKICVVYITDGDTGDQSRMTWSARSLAKNSDIRFDTIVLSNDRVIDLSKAVPELLTHGKYFNITDIYKTLTEVGIYRDGWNRRWPFEVLYRLGIPLHQAFDKYDRVLYLDTDTLVLSGDVDRMMMSDLTGYDVGGVPDTVQEAHSRISAVLTNDIYPEQAKRILSVLGNDILCRSYINAGVLMLNLSEIRSTIDWYKEALSIFWDAETRGLVGFLDQDFVNTMLRVKSDFSLVFNWFNRCDMDADHCVIRHYAGKQYKQMLDDAISHGFI